MFGGLARSVAKQGQQHVHHLLPVGQVQLLAQAKMSNSEWVDLYGGFGSPYTRKVQSALRYKKIPFSQHTLMPWDMMGEWEEKGFGHIKPKVSNI